MPDRDECSSAPECCQLPLGGDFSVVHFVRFSHATGSLQQRQWQGNFCGLCSSPDFAVMCHVPLHGPRLMIPGGHRAEMVASMSRERPYAVMRWMPETSRGRNGR